MAEHKLMQHLNYCYRLLATGFCFAIFGLGGLFITLIIIPLVWLVFWSTHRRQRAARTVVRWAFRFFIGLLTLVRVARFDIPQRHVLQNIRGKLVLANHPCLIDVVVLLSILPDADCVIKAALLRNPFISVIIRTTGYIANSDPDKVLQACEKTLSAGNNLIIFPEGTRTTPGQPPVLQRGAANIAVRCRADILVLGIRVTPCTLTKNTPWYSIPERRFTLSIDIKSDAPRPAAELTVSKETRRYTRALQDYFRKEVYPL